MDFFQAAAFKRMFDELPEHARRSVLQGLSLKDGPSAGKAVMRILMAGASGETLAERIKISHRNYTRLVD